MRGEEAPYFNKADASAQETVEKKAATYRTIPTTGTLNASELPRCIASLPRLLTEHLTVKASGVLTGELVLAGFYGPGSIMIEGGSAGNLTVTGNIRVTNCSTSVTVHFVDVQADSAVNDAIALYRSDYVFLYNCRVMGNNVCKGVAVTLGTMAYLLGCGFKSCQTAVYADSTGFVALANEISSTGSFSGNTIGAWVYRGGVILLTEATPELLGGVSNSKSGGLIVKADGTLL